MNGVLDAAFDQGLKPLDEQVIERSLPNCRIRRWWPGAHPELGGTIINDGLTGTETVTESFELDPEWAWVME